MAIQKLFTSRANNTNGNTFIGERGHIFYDENVGQLRLSDGHTAGGLPILVASTTANLGDLYVAGPTISTVNPNEDLNLDSNGTGNVNVVGSLRILTSTGYYATTPVLSASQQGNVTVNGNLITNGTTYLVGTTNFIGTTVHQGNLTTNGSLITNGSSYFTGPIVEIGNVTVTGNSVNNGTSTFNGLTIFNGDTTRTGNTTQSGNINITGNSTNSGSSTFNGGSTFNGTTYQNGNVVTTGILTIVGNTNQVGNLNITGTTINNGLSIFNGNLTIAGNASLIGNTTVSGTTFVTGNTLVTGNTNVIGTTFLTGNSYVTGNTFVTGTTTVSGNTYVTGQVTTITGNTYLTGNSFVTGATTVTGNITVTGNSVQTGQAEFIVTMSGSNLGAVEITGNTQGLYQTPQNTGVMLHTTGPDTGNVSGRLYSDSVNNYTVIAGRRYNGTIANPTQVLAGQDIVRWGGTPYGSSGWPTIGPARMTYTAGDNISSTAQGGYITFHTTANGTVTSNQILTATIDPAYGVTSPIGFVTTGNLTVGNVIASGNETVSGNVTASYFIGNGAALTGISTYSNTNVASYLPVYSGNVSAGNVAITLNESVGGNVTVTGNVTAANVNATLHGNVIGVATGLATAGTTAAGTFLTGQVTIPSQVIAKNTPSVDVTVTVTGLTTSHKVIVTPAADLNSGVILTAAYPTTANTLGVQLQNTNGGGITTTAFNLTYMAWI